MPSIEEYTRRPREERLARIARTPEELASAVRSVDAAVLTHRPAPKSWAPTEVVCHLRDNEEWFLERMRLIMVMDLPRFVATNPDRWADERQYLTNDASVALAAFTRRRRRSGSRAKRDRSPRAGRPIRPAGGSARSRSRSRGWPRGNAEARRATADRRGTRRRPRCSRTRSRSARGRCVPR